ncbi:MAG: hypothetical protein ACK5XD_04765 [Acidobacteriota bacterium]
MKHRTLAPARAASLRGKGPALIGRSATQGAANLTVDNRAELKLRIYDRALRTSEANAAVRAGL